MTGNMNMKYFCTETERKASRSTCYYEFQKGKYKDKCWNSDSLNLHSSMFNKLGLHSLFLQAVPNFDCWGLSKVSKSQWEKIKQMACETGGEVEKAIAELTLWAEECFQEETMFTICGM